MKNIISLIVLTVLAGVLLTSCGKNSETKVTLTGAGASFPAPLYTKWFSEYSKANLNVQINYQSIGSGGGIKQITEGTVDFGASDAPMTTEEKSAAETKGGSKIYHIPTCLGAVVLTYNLPGVTKPLNMTGDMVAQIYLGKIKKWNDPAIVKENPGVELPDKEIIPIYRTVGSGTTFIFTSFLGASSEEWKAGPGISKTVNFTTGQGAKGNEGVTGQVKQIQYSIGYVELIYAIQNKINFANIKNPNGEYVTPSLESVTKAAEVSSAEMPESLTMSIINAKGAGAYPISSYTYLLVFEKNKDAEKGKSLKKLVEWCISDGQNFANELGYSKLPVSVVAKVKDVVSKIQ